MNTSLRPGVGHYVNGRETASYPAGSFSIGEKIGSYWRVEAEYILPRGSEYTSGSSIFTTSLNHIKNKKQRVTLNLNRDIPLTKLDSFYLMAGVGASIARTTGWQGNLTRRFASSQSTNVTYQVGAGITRHLGQHHAIDFGYRFIDLGGVQSGLNSFTNVRKLQDEQLRGHLYLHEVLFGYRFTL
ncbi:outer membrane protein [Asaia sp. HN010]|uniref:outer membrane protein n=1 Tax=Asaia sp. HN010 TaxID=3081233 RepID=UPI0038D1804D